MSLILAIPDSIEDVQESIAAIQTAFGKQDAFGRWIYPLLTTEDLFVEGAGNSWTRQNYTSGVGISYKMSSDTSMTLSLRISNTLLTIATATSGVYLRIPGGYRAIGRQGGAGWLSDNGTNDGAYISSGGVSDRFVSIQHTGWGNFTGGLLSVVFQLEMDVRL